MHDNVVRGKSGRIAPYMVRITFDITTKCFKESRSTIFTIRFRLGRNERLLAAGTPISTDMATTNGDKDQLRRPNDPEGEKEKKQLILNGFVITSPGHLAPGLWKHPRNKTTGYKKLKFWTDLAQRLDKANFHALFIADVLGGYDVYKGPANMGPAIPSGAQFPINDPLYAVPAMAAVTKNLAFGVTASTTYDLPYSLARRFSTVDHLADGRVAWNIVTSYLDSAARNLGLNTQVEHDERYRIADEFMDVVYKLWEGSWRDDAVVQDIEKDQYAVPERVRQIQILQRARASFVQAVSSAHPAPLPGRDLEIGARIWRQARRGHLHRGSSSGKSAHLRRCDPRACQGEVRTRSPSRQVGCRNEHHRGGDGRSRADETAGVAVVR